MKISLLLTCSFLLGVLFLQSQNLQENVLKNEAISFNRLDNKEAVEFSYKGLPNKSQLIQYSLSSALDQEENLRKSHNRKITAWSLIGGGAALTAAGIIVLPKYYDFLESNTADDTKLVAGSIMTILGFAAMITSVPFFVSSGIYKRRAKLGVSNQKTGYRQPTGYDKDLTSLTLSIPIGK